MSRHSIQKLMFAVTGTSLALAGGCSAPGGASGEGTGQTAAALSTPVVISQVYGGGGNSGSTFTNDFVELFNPGTTAFSFTGYSLQYSSATGEFTAANLVTLPDITIQPGQYYLVQLAAGAGTSNPLPTPDFTNTATNVNLGATAGEVALANTTTIIPCTAAGACDLTTVVDLVGYGSTALLFEGSGPATAPSGSGVLSNGPSMQRKLAGCTDTGDNAADFENPVLTADPRNSLSPLNPCSAIDAGIDASDAALDATDGGVFSEGGEDAGDNDAEGQDAETDAGQDAGAADAGLDDGGLEDSGSQDGGIPETGVEDTGVDAGNDAGDGGSAEDAGSDAGVGNTKGLVISQIYGGGGNSSATYTNDFVELFNHGTASVSLSDLSLQYASATGNFVAANVAALPAVTIPVGHYYLVEFEGGATGTALPTADFTDTNTNLSSTAGKVVLAIGTAPLGCGGDAGVCSASAYVDLVGYGATASEFEGSGPATGPSGNTTSVARRGAGCIDTKDNAGDFENPAIAVSPRNSASAANTCSMTLSDAGGMDASMASDSGSGSDAGIKGSDGGLTGTDASALDSSADATRPDSGESTFDGTTSNGCSCVAVGTTSPPSLPAGSAALGALALVAARLRRKKRDAA